MQEVPPRHEPVKYLPQRLYEFSRRYRALLQTGSPDPLLGIPALLQELSRLLHGIFDFNFISYSLADSSLNVSHLHILDTNGAVEKPIELAIDNSAAGWVWSKQLPLILSDLSSEERFTTTLKPFRDKGVHSLILLPLSAGEQRLGAIGFGSVEPKEYDDHTIHFLEQVSGLVALAINNLLTRQALAGEEEQLRALTALSLQLSERSANMLRALHDQRSALEAVLEINAALAATKLDLKQMFPAVSKSLSRAIAHDTAFINLWSEEKSNYLVFAKASGNGFEFAPAGMVLPADRAFTSQVLDKFPKGAVVRRAELEAAAPRFDVVRSALESGIVCWCAVPMRSSDRLVGVLYLGSRSEDAFSEKDLDLARQVASALAVFVENAFTHDVLQRQKEGLQRLLEITHTFTPSLDSKKLLAENRQLHTAGLSP